MPADQAAGGLLHFPPTNAETFVPHSESGVCLLMPRPILIAHVASCHLPVKVPQVLRLGSVHSFGSADDVPRIPDY